MHDGSYMSYTSSRDDRCHVREKAVPELSGDNCAWAPQECLNHAMQRNLHVQTTNLNSSYVSGIYVAQ